MKRVRVLLLFHLISALSLMDLGRLVLETPSYARSTGLFSLADLSSSEVIVPLGLLKWELN